MFTGKLICLDIYFKGNFTYCSDAKRGKGHRHCPLHFLYPLIFSVCSALTDRLLNLHNFLS